MIGDEKGWRKSSKELKSWFLVSVVAAIVFALWRSDLLLETTVLNKNELSLLRYQEDGNKLFFLCVFRERFLIVPFLFLMSTTCLATVTAYGVMTWCGMAVGTIFTIAILRYGLGGALLVIGASLPHYLFYIPVLLITIHLSQRERKIDNRFVRQLIVLEMLVIIGCYVECCVNYLLVELLFEFFC